MLDPGKPSFTPKKGKTSVVMFVGLQGMMLNYTVYFMIVIYVWYSVILGGFSNFLTHNFNGLIM